MTTATTTATTTSDLEPGADTDVDVGNHDLGDFGRACAAAGVYAAASRAGTTRAVYAGAWRRWAALVCRHGARRRCPPRPRRSVPTSRRWPTPAARPPASRARWRRSSPGTPTPAMCSTGGIRPSPACAPASPASTRGLCCAPGRWASTSSPVSWHPLENGDVRALRDRALLLVGFFGALRRSELVAFDATT